MRVFLRDRNSESEEDERSRMTDGQPRAEGEVTTAKHLLAKLSSLRVMRIELDEDIASLERVLCMMREDSSP